MDVSARDIEQVEFHDAWRGYNQTEVDDFLDQVVETVERLTRENDALRARLGEIESSAESARVSEETMKKTLLAAEQTARDTIAEARAEAERMLGEASSGLDGRKNELESSLSSLQRFESETKERLRHILEEQLRALDSLSELPRSQPSSEPAAEQQSVPPVLDPTPDVAQVAPPEAIAELAAENALPPDDSSEVIVEEMVGTTADDTSLFDFDGEDEAEAGDEDESGTGEVSMDDFRPFDDEAALQSRRRRGLFRRRVDDWA